MKRYNVTVVWEAVAELKIMANSPEEAEKKAADRGLPWAKAIEGDPDHHSAYCEKKAEKCDHNFLPSPKCGCRVCDCCGEHKGLERCYCGWSRSGGDGRAELVEMGETIDEEG